MQLCSATITDISKFLVNKLYIYNYTPANTHSSSSNSDAFSHPIILILNFFWLTQSRKGHKVFFISYLCPGKHFLVPKNGERGRFRQSNQPNWNPVLPLKFISWHTNSCQLLLSITQALLWRECLTKHWLHYMMDLLTQRRPDIPSPLI